MKVKVKNWGAIYTTYDEWLKKNNCEQYLENYRQGDSIAKYFLHNNKYEYTPYDINGDVVDMANITYEVLAKNYHSENSGGILYLIQEPITNKVYLINEKGTEEVK